MSRQEAAAWADLVALAAEQGLEVNYRERPDFHQYGEGWGVAYLPLCVREARDVWFAEHTAESLGQAIEKVKAALIARAAK